MWPDSFQSLLWAPEGLFAACENFLHAELYSALRLAAKLPFVLVRFLVLTGRHEHMDVQHAVR
jgi:hypothetical protein